MSDIYKVAGVIIEKRRLLVVRTKGKNTFYAPGGKPNEGEDPTHALQRELEEEVSIRVRPERLENFGTFEAEAADQPGVSIKMDVFIVHYYYGTITPSHEIAEVYWLSSKEAKDFELGSIFKKQVVPKLVAQQLID